MNINFGYLEYVAEFLDELDEDSRTHVKAVVDLFERGGFLIGTKYTKKIVKNLWELRIPSEKANVRLFYFQASKNHFIASHAIDKKTQKLSSKDIRLACKRRDQYLRTKGT